MKGGMDVWKCVEVSPWGVKHTNPGMPNIGWRVIRGHWRRISRQLSFASPCNFAKPFSTSPEPSVFVVLLDL